MDKSKLIKSALNLIFLLITVFPALALSRQDQQNFTISTKNIYSPGENVSLNIYSYGNYGKKNADNLMFEIEVLKITDPEKFYSFQASRFRLDALGSENKNLLYFTDKIYSFKKKLKSNREYEYSYFNEDISVNIKEKGAFLIKVTSGKKVAYCGFIVSELGLVSKAGNNSVLAYVVNRKNGEPVDNADLDFFIGSKKIGQGKTSEGVFLQVVNEVVKGNSDENNYPVIIGKYGEDVLVSDPYLFFGYSGNKYFTYIYTEQPVYRTGLDVNFKGTIRINNANSLLPLKNKELTVIIKDSKNAEVYKEIVRTNDMGSFNGTYKLGDEAALGTYTIFANIDENNSYTANFSVEQYKKPEFKVMVIPGSTQYYGKDKLTAEAEARYFFGSPVADAEIEYNIYRIRYYKPWWMYSDYAWWYEDYYNNQDENQMYNGAEFLFTGTGKLDSEGKFKIDYNINEDFKEQNNYYNKFGPYYSESDYKYIIQAKVTDKSRREISGTSTVFVTRGGFTLSAKTDRYMYKPGENVNLTVYAENFSAKPVETKFEAVVYRSTWTKDYRENKDYVRSVSGKTLSDGQGSVNFDIGNTDAEGYYTVEIKSYDDRANEIKTSAGFYVSKGDMWWYYNQSGSVQIIPEKDSYRQGETCRALVLINNPDANVLITTATDDILYFKTEKFNGTSKIIEIPVTDKYFSNFEININYVYDGVFYNSGKTVMVIPEEKFLTVTIDPSKLIYKPRESAKVRVKVTDNSGNPVKNAEVSIGVVDESIYSIKEDNTGDIRKFFYGNRFTSVSTAFNNISNSNGTSRLISIYERFNLRSTDEKELATVRGRFLNKNNSPVKGASIIIDGDYYAAVTDADGNFEFKLLEGKYSISAYYKNIEKEDLKELILVKGQIKNITLYNSRELNETEDRDELIMDGQFQNDGMRGMTLNAPKYAAPEVSKKEKNSENISDIGSVNMITPDVRSDFRDAIFWSPYSVTDVEGYAEVEFNFPDNLTEWRITSRVITEDTKVGQMTSTVITRKDLLVRMETPRFFQENDEVTVSTIIHNYLKTEKKARVKFTAENVTVIGSSSEKNISIAPDSETRLDWKIKVTQPQGTAKLYAEALTDEESDALEISVPLQPQGLEIIKNTIADFSDEYKSELKTVEIPSGTDLRSSGMKFTVDASLASVILNSLDELAGYPYGCVEQTMSRFLPTVIVAKAFREINAPLSDATKKDLPLMVNKGLQRLYSFQHQDGGWGWWENDNSNPFMTAYVIYGLAMAKESGYEISEGVFRNGKSSVKNLISKKIDDKTTLAYMLYALAVSGNENNEFIEKNLNSIDTDKLNDYAKSLIAMTWKLIGNDKKAKDELFSLEKNVKTGGEGAAYWEGKEFHYSWQDDKVQTTAMALKAIVNIDDNSGLKEKVIRWLMMQRQGTAWRNTQETAMVIYAMVDYLKNSQELDPDYTVKVFVNNNLLSEMKMNKDNIFSRSVPVIVDNKNLRAGSNEIRIEKSGKGKVYFSSGTSYYDNTSGNKSSENGFRVEREYFKLEKYESYSDDKIVYRKKYFDGNLKSGVEFLVKIRVSSRDNENNYFMLEDFIPSGAEVVKDDWAYRIEGENDFQGYNYFYWRWWYADKEIRDNRVVFFASYMGKGEYEFSYILRAQIPGDYSVNPSRGMLMYYPEYNGNSDIARISIRD
ncbi:MAG: hypothetical protein JSS91_11580 [Bacteroidetes bacterium]|nr:hypothetical protein [Bacteroidota bacterium]